MALIQKSVGAGRDNQPRDVANVQTALIRHRAWLDSGCPDVTGKFDAATARAIKSFQTNAAALLQADGLVTPASFTARQLDRQNIPKPQHRVFLPACWFHADGLSEIDFDRAADSVGCEAAVIRAVASVETLGRAWEAVGRPVILFERHHFSRLTSKAFDATHPDISNPVLGGYGLSSAQYGRLSRAAVLDEQAALQSASWGSFQILGEYYSVTGFDTVDAFVSAMLRSEKDHLAAFVSFVKANAKLTKALQERDWAEFARRYNGPDYASHEYDAKMAAAYAAITGKRAAPTRPDLR